MVVHLMHLRCFPIILPSTGLLLIPGTWEMEIPILIANPPVQNYGPGIYIIKGTMTTTGGCTATIVDTVKVGTIHPVANFSANPVSACVGQKIQFNDLSTGSPDQWFWSFGDGSTWTSQNPKFAYTTPGTYSVKLIAYNNGCADSITKSNYIIVNPPLAKFSYSYNCSNTDTHIHSMIHRLALRAGIGISETDNQLQDKFPAPHTYATPGVYTVTLTVTNGVTSCRIKAPKQLLSA